MSVFQQYLPELFFSILSPLPIIVRITTSALLVHCSKQSKRNTDKTHLTFFLSLSSPHREDYRGLTGSLELPVPHFFTQLMNISGTDLELPEPWSSLHAVPGDLEKMDLECVRVTVPCTGQCVAWCQWPIMCHHAARVSVLGHPPSQSLGRHYGPPSIHQPPLPFPLSSSSPPNTPTA